MFKKIVLYYMNKTDNYLKKPSVYIKIIIIVYLNKYR